MSILKPGKTWRERAGRIVLDPLGPHDEVMTTSMDRRWLWRIEGLLAVSATCDAQRQLTADLRAYLGETCEHHWRDYAGDDDIPAHRQCLWCNEVEWADGGAVTA
jgi:hypothetical protein